MGRKLISFDWAMKRILREKENFDILEGFLTELLKFDIKIEEILESEANQETEEDKFNRVDLLAKNSRGELVLIEIQHSSELDYFHRMVYGSSKLIAEYISKGRGYREVKKVYSINIVYFDLGQGEDYIYYGKTDFVGIHRNDILQLSQHQKRQFGKSEVSQIFPEYYILKINRFDDTTRNSLDEWIYFLKNEEIMDNFRAKGLREAKRKLDIMKLPPKERAIYKRREENRIYQESMIFTAKEEGRQEGLREGLEKGIERGLKKGKTEIAKGMLRDNLDIEVIAKYTGLSIEEIEQLQN